jgi:hypothetical protein
MVTHAAMLPPRLACTIAMTGSLGRHENTLVQED